MLNFIGIGSAFNTKLGNTSAFIRENDSMLLIDCGGTVFHRLMELKLLNDLKQLYIVITHTHPDHVGSLGEVIFYSYFILRHRPTVIFPNKEVLENFLAYIGVSKEMYLFESGYRVTVSDEHLGQLSIEFMPVTHVETIPAYGFLMIQKGRSLYYSGDANGISAEIITKFRNGKIDKVYQDTCGLDYEGNSHMSLRKLSEAVSPEFRDKVYCIHLDKHISQREAVDLGFNVVEVYK